MTALEHLGRLIAQRTALPPALRASAGMHLADTVAAWIAGARTPEGRALIAYARDVAPEAAVRGDLRRRIATHCALARLSEIDDIHLASMTTPGAIIIPAVLTLATVLPRPDAAGLSQAIAVGYEAMVRFGQAVDGPSILYRGIWPTYLAAPFGVAAAAARFLELDAGAAAHALALALVRAAPGFGAHGAATTARWLAIGEAAAAGLDAALAARAGFTADVALFEGAFLPNVYQIRPRAAALTDGLDGGSGLPEVSFKPWCAARQTMAATQALVEIVRAGLPPEDIAAVTACVVPPHRKMIDHGVVARDRASYLTSLPYQMARAALAGPASEVGEPSPPSAAVRELMAKITIEPDEQLLASYPSAWPAQVKVEAASGKRLRRVTHVPGDPARPLGREGVKAKFLRHAAPPIGPEAAEGLFDLCTVVIERDDAAPALMQRLGTLGVTIARGE